jgi:hypothetical protein
MVGDTMSGILIKQMDDSMPYFYLFPICNRGENNVLYALIL